MSEPQEECAGREPYGTHLARIEADYPDYSIYGTKANLYAARRRGENGRLVGEQITAETLDELAPRLDAARRQMNGAS